jgi:methylthioribose-1-phosphate isomerase
MNQVPKTLEWIGDETGHLLLLDQTALPLEERFIEVRNVPVLVEAISCLAVRGAPAIGVAAAYGFYLGVRELTHLPLKEFREKASVLADTLIAT